MSEVRTYASPMAFRRALTDKLKKVEEESKWELPQLQRQIAYDRLLERLYEIDEGWIVKGATALLARNLGVRATIDIDVYRNLAADEAERELRDAAVLDLNDWFSFEIERPEVVGNRGTGRRMPVRALIGTTAWAEFKVDLTGQQVKMTGKPEKMPALARVSGLVQNGYRVYPLVDHVADKVAATFDHYGASESGSSRYKDLVDLVAIARDARIEAEPQITALASEFEWRRLVAPSRFAVPDHDEWKRGYERAAAESLLEGDRRIEEALALMERFIDPLLDGSAEKSWDPLTSVWR